MSIEVSLVTPYGIVSEGGNFVEVKKNYIVEQMGTEIEVQLG